MASNDVPGGSRHIARSGLVTWLRSYQLDRCRRPVGVWETVQDKAVGGCVPLSGMQSTASRALRRTIPSLFRAGIAHPITCVCVRSALAANACEESSMRMAL